MVDYTLIRTNRKTVAIHVNQDATVEVRAPLRAAKAEIDRMVASKLDWIRKHQSIRAARTEQKAAFSLRYGDTALFQGKPYPIEARPGNRAGFDGQRFYLPPGLPPEEIKRLMIRTYRLIAKNVLTDKAMAFGRRMGVAPAAVKINGAKTRWGSCSAKGSINFCWRLIMADEDTIGYVVVHELAHIREQNHSERFWALVAAVFPDYKARRERLKELQRRLNVEDWE